MLQINSIQLTQFKNYKQQQFNFTKNVVGICGKNGVGKTNLIDAIYFLSFTKSYFNSSDVQNVHNGLQGFRIEGQYTINLKNKHQIVCILRENNKKELEVNAEVVKKFSEHIGNYPAVFIAPDDVKLITSTSEERRKFIDTILCQINKTYLGCLYNYNKLLQQRNSLLKQMAEQNLDSNNALLEILSNQLANNGDYIFEQRQKFLTTFLPLVNNFYKTIANKQDEITITYNSQLNSNNLIQLLTAHIAKDKILQRTSVGIHKDDLEIFINNQVFKNQASQGQRKSLLFALKLAEWQTLKQHKNLSPILLIDDAFEKLDEERMQRFLQFTCSHNDTQIFITDTHFDRLHQTLSSLNVQFEIISL